MIFLKRKITAIILAFLFLNIEIYHAQNKVIDSLNLSIKTDNSGLDKMKALNALSWDHLKIGNSDSAINASNRALLLAKDLPEVDRQRGNAQSFANIAMANADKGNFSDAITYFLKALKIGEDLGNKIIISNNLSNISNVYGSMGEYDKSL